VVDIYFLNSPSWSPPPLAQPGRHAGASGENPNTGRMFRDQGGCAIRAPGVHLRMYAYSAIGPTNVGAGQERRRRRHRRVVNRQLRHGTFSSAARCQGNSGSRGRRHTEIAIEARAALFDCSSFGPTFMRSFLLGDGRAAIRRHHSRAPLIDHRCSRSSAGDKLVVGESSACGWSILAQV